MAQPRGLIYGQKANQQIQKTVREVARRLMNEMPHRARWQQRAGTGGGGNTIWFTIDEVLCPDGYEVTEKTLVVTPTWYTGGCDAAIPEQDPYTGTVNVYDICSYLDYHVDAELPGTVGRATYMYPRTGTCEPRWILDDLCHQPECA